MVENARHRAQVVFREATAYSREVGSWRSTEAGNPWSHYLAVGILETDVGALPDEALLGFLMGGPTSGFRLSMTGEQPQEEARGIAVCDAGGVLTNLQVRSPQGPAALVAHGGLFLRRTRFPSPRGRETLLLLGLLRHGPDLPQRTMFELEGGGGDLRVTSSRPAPDTFAPGSTPACTLAMPIWGFGEEPRGFRSTLSLRVIDQMKEITALRAEPIPSPEQEARLLALARSDGADVMRLRDRERRFARWIEIGRETGRPVDADPDSCPTALESEALQANAQAAMEALFAERAEVDGPRF